MPTLLIDLSPLERFNALSLLTHSSEFSEQEATEPLFQLSPLSTLQVPDDREATVVDNEFTQSMLEIISALCVVDVLFEELFDYRKHVYVLRDDSIVTLLRAGAEGVVSSLLSERLPVILEILATIGLIYRFSVAPKFGYFERQVMQLRLNSWGRALVEARQLEERPHYLALSAHWCEVFNQHTDAYRELLDLCNNDARPLQTKHIIQLNAAVPVKIVT